jgi:hypothetical protein
MERSVLRVGNYIAPASVPNPQEHPMRVQLIRESDSLLAGDIDFDLDEVQPLSILCGLLKSLFNAQKTPEGYVIGSVLITNTTRCFWVQDQKVKYLHELQNIIEDLTGEKI